MRILKFIALSVVLVGLNSPGAIHIWNWNTEISKIDRISSAIIDSIRFQRINKIPIEKSDDCFHYFKQKIEIWRCNDNLKTSKWESPDDWKITEVIFSDLNRDGVDEIGLLVWRPFESWPIDKFLPNNGRIAKFHDQQGQSCHFILVGWDGDEYRELWAGSALAAPLSQVNVGDIDGDGFEELIALEKEYDSSNGGDLTVWKWQGFGFSLVDRLEGIFSDYSLILNNDQLIILTN